MFKITYITMHTLTKLIRRTNWWKFKLKRLFIVLTKNIQKKFSQVNTVIKIYCIIKTYAPVNGRPHCVKLNLPTLCKGLVARALDLSTVQQLLHEYFLHPFKSSGEGFSFENLNVD